MAVVVELTKGKKFNLTKDNPGLAKIELAAQWDQNQFAGDQFDIDISAAMLVDGKLQSQTDLVFFGTPGLTHPSKSVKLSGDNRTGEGDGDDEVIYVEFDKIPENVDKIRMLATVYQAKKLNQNFGMIDSAKVFVRNSETKEDLAKFDMSEDFDSQISLVVGELYRHDGEWKFSAIGQGYDDKDLNDLLQEM